MLRANDPSREPAAAKTKSLMKRTWGGVKWFGSIPGRAFPNAEVAEGGRSILRLIATIRGEQRCDSRFRTYEDRSFNIEGTAFLHGMPVWRLETLLARRRRQTALAAYIFFGLGWACFLYWLFKIATTPWSTWRIVPFLEFTPFSLFLFLMAFRTALQNYQIRTRRLVTAGEYLSTSGQFWPS